jgi:hypothetical protein
MRRRLLVTGNPDGSAQRIQVGQHSQASTALVEPDKNLWMYDLRTISI